MTNKRRHERFPMDVEVEISVAGLLRRQRRILRTRDLSDGGVFVLSDERTCPAPGTVIEIRLTGLVDGQDPPVVRAKVVRVTPDGMAIAFVS